ncbi:uncharacterized protein LOC124132908 [Haliotis rufescens]|uniref:uncharacterized protein LOC124132908 n=1 Tax=Haliotis rufescens TaxID=6454 RepID=UPI00201F738E|nr:uncharacterized protein LOC124132908 [Haliotis rufescens]XP_048254400.1 uncharacterized protein LOC124132908 [Haliotis rufescens]XP_048254401.1 uncharacterized protein LOC124132908 [Haliotis rufescens]
MTSFAKTHSAIEDNWDSSCSDSEFGTVHGDDFYKQRGKYLLINLDNGAQESKAIPVQGKPLKRVKKVRGKDKQKRKRKKQSGSVQSARKTSEDLVTSDQKREQILPRSDWFEPSTPTKRKMYKSEKRLTPIEKVTDRPFVEGMKEHEVKQHFPPGIMPAEAMLSSVGDDSCQKQCILMNAGKGDVSHAHGTESPLIPPDTKMNQSGPVKQSVSEPIIQLSCGREDLIQESLTEKHKELKSLSGFDVASEMLHGMLRNGHHGQQCSVQNVDHGQNWRLGSLEGSTVKTCHLLTAVTSSHSELEHGSKVSQPLHPSQTCDPERTTQQMLGNDLISKTSSSKEYSGCKGGLLVSALAGPAKGQTPTPRKQQKASCLTGYPEVSANDLMPLTSVHDDCYAGQEHIQVTHHTPEADPHGEHHDSKESMDSCIIVSSDSDSEIEELGITYIKSEKGRVGSSVMREESDDEKQVLTEAMARPDEQDSDDVFVIEPDESCEDFEIDLSDYDTMRVSDKIRCGELPHGTRSLLDTSEATSDGWDDSFISGNCCADRT